VNVIPARARVAANATERSASHPPVTVVLRQLTIQIPLLAPNASTPIVMRREVPAAAGYNLSANSHASDQTLW
jgi:hypothetical protein